VPLLEKAIAYVEEEAADPAKDSEMTENKEEEDVKMEEGAEKKEEVKPEPVVPELKAVELKVEQTSCY